MMDGGMEGWRGWVEERDSGPETGYDEKRIMMMFR